MVPTIDEMQKGTTRFIEGLAREFVKADNGGQHVEDFVQRVEASIRDEPADTLCEFTSQAYALYLTQSLQKHCHRF